MIGLLSFQECCFWLIWMVFLFWMKKCCVGCSAGVMRKWFYQVFGIATSLEVTSSHCLILPSVCDGCIWRHWPLTSITALIPSTRVRILTIFHFGVLSLMAVTAPFFVQSIWIKSSMVRSENLLLLCLQSLSSQSDYYFFSLNYKFKIVFIESKSLVKLF